MTTSDKLAKAVKTGRELMFLAATMLCLNAAAATVEVTEDATISLTADSDTSYEIADGVTLTIDATGVTNVLSGRITGTGTAKLRKTGLGTLALSNVSNVIPGGIDVAQGTVRADAEGCLGDGDITISQTTANRGQIYFNADGATFGNMLSITGSAGSTFNASSPYALKFSKSVTLTGNVTSSGQYTSFWNDDVSGLTVTFNGDVTCNAGSNRLYLRPNGVFVFNGAVTAYRFRIGNSATASSSPVYLNNSRNAITYLDTYSARVHCGDANVLAGAYWTMPGINSRGRDRDSLYLHGYNQTLKHLDSVATGAVTSDARCPISSDEPCTLTLTGSGTRKSAHVLLGAVSLVVDADASFVQEFSDVKSTVDTTHSTTGTITIKKGTLTISGMKTSFSGVPEVAVEENGALSLMTSGQTLFPALTNIVVEGSLSIGPDAAVPFEFGAAEITFGENATLEVNNDSKTLFSKAYVIVGGVKNRLPAGDYTAGNEAVPQLKAGGFTVLGESAVVTEATWTGAGGVANSITNEANWSESGLDFTSGILSPTFVSGEGVSTAVVHSAVSFKNMTIVAAECEDGFTFAKGSNDGAVTITGTSLDVTDTDSTNRTYAFDVPFVVEGAQKLTVSLPAKKTLAMNEGVSVPDGALQFTGAGTVRLSGESAISGAMSIESGMTAYLTGLLDTPGGVDQGLASVDGARTFTVNGGSTADSDWKGLVLTNATVRKPLAIRGNSSNSQKYLLHTMAGTTNEISGNLYFSVGYGRNNIKLRRNSELTCSGGMRVGKSTVCIDGDAGSRLVFTEKPVTSTVDYVYNDSTYYFGLGIYYGHVVFDVCGNAITYLRPGLYNSANYATTLEFLRSDMFSSTDTTLAAGMYNSGSALRPLSVEAFQTVEFHATTQRFARVLSGKTATFNGGEGSLLEVCGAQMPDEGDAPHVTETSLYVAAAFTGGLSLKMGGTGTLLLTNAVSSTSGGIEVTNGVVRFASDAAWTNASYIAVGGTGRLEIDAETNLGRLATFRKDTALSLSGEGVISIPDGDELRFGSLTVDGAKFSCGRFIYATAPAALRAHLAETTGAMLVGRTGTVFLLK